MPLGRIAVLSTALVFLFISADASAKPPHPSRARVPAWCSKWLARPAIREGIKPLGEGRYLVNARLYRQPFEETPRCRIVPSFRHGRAIGFKVFGIRPGSIEGQAGLTNGDTVRSIDGEELSSPDRALSIYGRLGEANFSRMVVERRGAEVTLDYCVDRRQTQ